MSIPSRLEAHDHTGTTKQVLDCSDEGKDKRYRHTAHAREIRAIENESSTNKQPLELTKQVAGIQMELDRERRNSTLQHKNCYVPSIRMVIHFPCLNYFFTQHVYTITLYLCFLI